MEGMSVQENAGAAGLAYINREIVDPLHKSRGNDEGAVLNRQRFSTEEIAIQDRQEARIDQIESFHQTIQRVNDPIYRLQEDGDNPEDIEARKRTIEDVRRYVREDEPKSTVSKKELKKREQRYHTKLAIARSVKDVRENTESDCISARLASQREYNSAQANPNEGERVQYQVQSIAFIDTLKIDALAYKNDQEFIRKSHDWMVKIATAEKLYRLFSGPNGDEAYEAYFASRKITSPAVKQKVKEEIEAKITQTLVNQKRYIETKLELIQNPYYTLLAKSDLDDLSEEELTDKAAFFARLRKPALATYITKLIILKQLTDPNGRAKLSRSRDVVDDDSYLIREKDGSVTTITKKVETNVLEGHQKLTGAITSSSSHLKAGTERTDDGKDAISSRKMEKTTITENSDGTQTVEKTKVGKSEKGFGEQMANSALSSLGLTYELGGSYTGKKGTISRKNGNTEVSATGSMFTGSLSGSVGATLFDINGSLAPSISAEVGGEFAVLEGEAKAEFKKKLFEDGKLILANASTKAKGALGKVKGKAKASLGKIKIKKKNVSGQDIEIEEVGVTLSANGGAYLATGSVSGSIGLLGVEATAKAEFSVGIGGSFKYQHTTGRVQMTIGVVMGIGGKISFTLDYGNLVDTVKRNTIDRFCKYVKRKYKASHREKYGVHKTERGYNLGANAYRLSRNIPVV